MARIRTIKPEFPQSESMGNVSRDARLTFILLWTIADDSGRLRGNSRMLASLLFPYDNDAPKLMDGWLSQLEAQNCIVRYEHNECSYIEIPKWLDHQKIDKPSASKFPSFANVREDSSTIRERSSLDQGPRTKEGTKDQGRDQGPKDQEKNAAHSLSAKADGYSVEEFYKRWNDFAKSKPPLRTCRCLTAKRRSWIKTRLGDAKWFAAFREAIGALPLLVTEKSDWQPGLDWLVKSEHNVYRILEGDFDWRISSDSALKKLQKARRQKAAQNSEAEAERQRKQEKASIPQTRNAIAGILNRQDGNGGETADSSLLFGSPTESSVNGAAISKPNGQAASETSEKSCMATLGRESKSTT